MMIKNNLDMIQKWNAVKINTILIMAFIATNIVNPRVFGDPFREGKMIVFFFLILIAGCFWIARRFDFFLAGVVAIASAQWAWASGPGYGITPTAGVIGFLYLGHVASQNEWTTHLVLRATTWLQVVFCVLQIISIQTFGSDDPYFHDLIVGSMGHPVVVGAWFAAVAPLAWFYWSRTELAICIALCLWSGSTMAIMALLAGGGYLLVRRFPKLWLLCIPAVIFLALGVYLLPHVEFFSLSGRMLPWKVAYEWILKSPWVGYGPGGWDGLYGCRFPPGSNDCTINYWGVQYARRWNFLHNDWLQLIFELGIPAFILSVVSAYCILRKAAAPYAACIAAILINAIGGFPLHLPPLAFLFIVALGLGVRDNDREGKRCGIY